MSWRDSANEVLAQLFVVGRAPPTKQQLFDAYPFGERNYTPYKVWLEQIKRWKLAHTAGRSTPRDMGPAARARKREKLANQDKHQGKLL